MNGYKQYPCGPLSMIYNVNLFAGIRIPRVKERHREKALEKAKISKRLRYKYDLVFRDAFYFGKKISSLDGSERGKKIDLSQIEKELERVRKDIPNAELFLMNASYMRSENP